MAISKITNFTKKVSDLPDVPSPTITPSQIKGFFDSAPEELRTKLNEVIDGVNVFENKTADLDSIKTNVTNNTNTINEKADKTYVDSKISNIGTATPKGAYATLSALQTAFPTGTTGVYVVTADGNWYYWSGTAWTVGGTYQSTAFADGSVTLPKLSQDSVDYLKKTKVTNILLNSNFPDLTSWTTTLATNISTSGSAATFTATARFGQIKQDTGIFSTTGDKYYVGAMVKAFTGNVKFDLNRTSGGSPWGTMIHSGSGNYELLSSVITTTDVFGITFRVFDDNTSGWQPISMKQPMLINLTKIFGAGKEPTKTDFEAMLIKYLGALYFSGISYIPFLLGEYYVINDKLSIKPDKLTLANKVVNGNFVDTTNWSFLLSSGSMAVNEATFTATAQFGQLYQTLGNSVSGNKYYVSAQVKATTNNAKLQLYRSDTGVAFGEAIHSGSGAYETLSFIGTPTVVTQMRVRTIDYRTSAWTSIQFKGVTVVNLTEMFGAGNEPFLTDFEAMIKKNNSNNIFFDGNLITNVLTSDVYKPPTASLDKSMLPIYINRTGDVIKVNSRYNDTQDLRVTLQKKGANSILDFLQFDLLSNTTNITSNDTSGSGTVLLANQTDFFGPHIVKAVNNITGDLPSSSDFTGGNHGYSGGTTGTPTGRTISVTLFVDGRKVNDFSGYCSYIDVYWVNGIQASNTKKADGSGREVLQENYHLHFDGYKWSVRNRIEFLEDVTWEKYYGLQANNAAWNGQIFYHSSSNRKWNDLLVNTDSGNTRCNKMTLKKNNDRLEFALYESEGIGNKEYLIGNSYGAFSTNMNKSYFYMVLGSNLFYNGDNVSYEGHYRFYSK